MDYGCGLMLYADGLWLWAMLYADGLWWFAILLMLMDCGFGWCESVCQ